MTACDDDRVFCRTCRHWIKREVSMQVQVGKRYDGGPNYETRRWMDGRCNREVAYQHPSAPHRCDQFERRR